MIFEFIVYGDPTGKQEKLSRGDKFVHRYLKPASRKFQDLVRFEAVTKVKELDAEEFLPSYKGPVRLGLKFYFTKPKSRPKKFRGIDVPRKVKPDTDNLVKAVQDGLSHVTFYDDAQVWKLDLEKWETDGTPRTEVTVYTEDDAQEGMRQ